MPGVAHTGVEWEQESARQTPVDDNHCVWCKLPQEEWDDGVEAVSVGDEEVICSNCLGDLRAWERYEKVVTQVSSAYGPAMRAIVRDYMEELIQELTERFPDDPDFYFMPTYQSNAAGKKEAPEPGENEKNQ